MNPSVITAKELVATNGTANYERWYWQQLLDALDKAGYILVKKPELMKRGNHVFPKAE
jgi:hypothetical protein